MEQMLQLYKCCKFESKLPSMYFSYDSKAFTYEYGELVLRSEHGRISVDSYLDKKKNGTDNNFISTVSRRVIIHVKSDNIKTKLGDDLVDTWNLCNSEESHFQYSTLYDIPDMESIRSVYDASKKYLDENYSYVGSVRVIDLDTKKALQSLCSVDETLDADDLYMRYF